MYYEDLNQLSTQYDEYFKGNKNSLYNKRFGDKAQYTLQEKAIVTSYINKTIKIFAQQEINILYFGCGNGRTQPIILNYISGFPHIKFIVTEYDISKVGLDIIVNNLIEHGFTIQDPEEKFYKILAKNNIVIKLVLGSPDLSTRDLENILQNRYHLVLSLFGVISHIPSYQKRFEIIKLLSNLTINSGILLLSLPSYKSHASTLKKFEFLRQYNLIEDLNLAIQRGDIYYKVQGTDAIYNFYHLYTTQEARDMLSYVGLSKVAIGVYSTDVPFNICQSRFHMIKDYMMSQLFSLPIINNIFARYYAKYFYISGQK